jgi:hypothetical protein
MNESMFDVCGLAKCPNIHCVCVLTFTEMALIFLMDVVAWEILKHMFRKEIKSIKERMFGKERSFIKELNEI